MPGTAPTAENDRAYLGQLPPLIDRETFFGDPQIAGAQISPDGRWISFRKPYNDVMNIWVKGIDEPFDAAHPLTADTTRPVSGYFWTEDSRYVLYVQDKGGDENFHLYAVDPAAAPEAAT
jgi:Tol biopolymer transport system component